MRELRSDDDWNQVLDLRLEVSRDDGPLPLEHGAFLERSTDESRTLVAEAMALTSERSPMIDCARWSASSRMDNERPASRTWPPEPTTVGAVWPEAWWYERGSSASRSWGRRPW